MLKKGNLSCYASITLLFAVLGGSVSTQTIPTWNKGLSQEQMEIAKIITSYPKNYTDENGNKQPKSSSL
jgi:hypothetical protein